MSMPRQAIRQAVTIDEHGTTAGENMSHEDASWNEEEDDE